MTLEVVTWFFSGISVGIAIANVITFGMKRPHSKKTREDSK